MSDAVRVYDIDGAPIQEGNPFYVRGDMSFSDSKALDAFGRLRVSSPKTLLDFKQTVDNLPLFFDDSETSGSGTSSSYQTNKAMTRISVSATTAGTRVRQSKLWGNYQPGKSQLILMTYANIATSTGIKKQCGYYWDRWGMYLKHEDGTAYFGIRTYNTGSAVDNDIAQTSWNIDKLDGTGKSGIDIDFTKTNIIIIDFEWLSVGRVRMGFVIDGLIYYAHEFLHANIEDEPYMSNPNAPIRYEISNDGTGAADSFDTICASVQSEGGQESTAITTYVSRNGTSITLANQDLYTPVLSIRKKSDRICTRIDISNISTLLTTNTNFEWSLFLNPTIAGTDNVSWTDVTNSSLQYDISRDNTNTLSGGYILDGGYGSSSGNTRITANSEVTPFLTLGVDIDGTLDEIVLAVKNIDGNGGTCYAGMTLREYC